MEQNSTEPPAELDLDALINPPSQESAMTVTTNVSNLKQEPNALLDSGSFKAAQNSTFTQNGASGSAVEVIDLTRPVKTEGESSSEVATSLANSDSIMRSASTPTLAGLTTMSPFGSPMALAGSQLSQEEHSAAYKKANILAITALTRTKGANAKELLAVQQKLQEFLTSLITLASQKGPQLKQTVQQLVQHLVTGAITEEEFASRVEQDLQSQHQPSLLPFLKNSVPSLKARLQLQQAIMKEILQRHQRQTTTTTTTTPQQPDASQQKQQQLQPPVNKQQQQQQNQTSQQIDLTLQPPSKQQASPSPSPSPSPATQQQQKQQQHPPTTVTMATPSGNSAPSLQQTSHTLMELAKLASNPEAQGKLVEMQLAMASRRQQQAQATGVAPSTATTAALQNATLSTVTVQAMLERQQQFAREKQAALANSAKASLSTSPALNRQAGSKSPSSAITTAMKGTPVAQSSAVLGKGSFTSMKLVPSSSASPSPASLAHGRGKHKGKGKDVNMEEEEEDEGMDIAGVNLQEESILPATMTEGVSRTCKDEHLLELRALRWKVASIASRYGITDVTDDFLSLLSHATQERLTGILEKLAVVSQHRLESIKDNPQYQVVSEVKGQLKVLEAIDRLNDKRKQEREKEKILRAAKSRSKGDDPAMAVKIKQQAKQLQQEEEAMILNQAANKRALAAIGTRKRPLQPDPSSQAGTSSSSSSSSLSDPSSLFGASGAVRQTKRRITSRDVLFHLEQERESRKSLFLYKNFLK